MRALLVGVVACLGAAVAASAEGARGAGLGLRGGSMAPPLQLVNGAGELVAPTAASVAESVPSGAALSVVASVGGSAKGRRLLNALFGTDFPTSQRLGGASEDEAGAWLAASPSSPGCLVLDSVPLRADGPQRSAADACKLASFSLAIADALIVHAPCVTPTDALLKEEYERIFTHHLATSRGAAAAAKTVLVHVADAAGGAASAAGLRGACREAWTAAAASTELKGTDFAEHFDLELVSMPHAEANGEVYAAAVASLRAKLKSLGVAGKHGAPAGFADAASAAWAASGAAFDGLPSEDFLRERYLAGRAYELGYAQAQAAVAKWAPLVAKGRVVRNFGGAAADALAAALATFDGGVADFSTDAAEMVAARRARLAKSLTNDLQELFAKQHRLLTLSTIGRFKGQLLKVMARAGSVAEWQQEGLRRNAEKHFDAGVAQLIVPGLGGLTRPQLTTAFGKQLTELSSKFIESPPMQLQAIGAMRRRTNKGMKGPRGVRAGLGLVGAVRSQAGGGQGNLATFAGYQAGLNSAHLMFANDGLIPDSSGNEPPFFRWQPKMNFDISI